MKKAIILAGVATAAFAFPTAAHADSVQTSATCDGLTVTAPAGSRVMIGLDAEPPYEVDDGNTRTVKFFQGADHHVWAVTVLGPDGGYADHADGAVDGCVPKPIPFIPTDPEPTIPSPTPVASVSTAVVVTEVAPVPWASVALAPPW